MKIIKDSVDTVIKHYRVIEVEDGPVVDAGEDYSPGTRMRVEEVRFSWLEEAEPHRVVVFGHRINKNGRTGAIRLTAEYPAWRGLPEWLEAIVQLHKEEEGGDVVGVRETE